MMRWTFGTMVIAMSAMACGGVVEGNSDTSGGSSDTDGGTENETGGGSVEPQPGPNEPPPDEPPCRGRRCRDDGGRPDPGPAMSDEYSITPCAGATPPLGIDQISALPECNDLCGGGHCIPSGLAPSGGTSALPQCPNGDTCIPDAIAKTGGQFIFTRCESALDAVDGSGACVPYCLVGDNASFLDQGSCAAGELCAPCHNPLEANAPTGACDDFCGGGGAPDAGTPDVVTPIPDAASGAESGSDAETTSDATAG